LKKPYNVRFIDEVPHDYGRAMPDRGWVVFAIGPWEAGDGVFRFATNGNVVLVSDWMTGAGARVFRRGEPKSPDDADLSSTP